MPDCRQRRRRGPRALANGDAGVLVPPADPAALASALDGLLRDPRAARELGQRAARRAGAEYDLSQMVRRYAWLYAGLVARRGRPSATREVASDSAA